MKKWMVSAVGKDQAGIVAALTRTFYSLGGNIEDTSMTRLADFFTVLIILHAPPELSQTDIEGPLKEVTQAFELLLDIHPIETETEQLEVKGQPWTLSVSGADHLGIIYHITQALAELSINITHLSSKRIHNKSGAPLFLMALEAEVPDKLAKTQWLEDFKQIAESHQLELHAEPLEIYTL